MDPRLLEGGFYSAVVWIENMLQEWLEEVTPGDVCRQIVALDGVAWGRSRPAEQRR